MSPAIHMGAERLLVISLRTVREMDRPTPGENRRSEPEPRFSNIVGHMLNTVFLDKLDYDLDQMRRINYMIQDFEARYGPDALAEVNQVRAETRIGPRQVPAIKVVRPFMISPSENIGHIAAELFGRIIRHRERLSPMHRFFANVVEAEGDNDFMSYLLFEPEFLHALIELGYEDARREHDRLVNFFSNRALNYQPQAEAQA